jgi:mono/diheme cytochrome c family protein
MNGLPQKDSRQVPAAINDENLLTSHEKLLGRQPDDSANYRLLPLGILFFLSGLILFSATYLNRYSGHFAPTIYDENLKPSQGPAEAAKVDPVALGKRLFNTPGACVSCHQPTGQGVPGVYPPLAGSEWAQGPENRVLRILLNGLSGPVSVKGATYNVSAMPAFGPSGSNWSDDKIAAVLTYVRQEWGNKAPPISPEKVAAIRAQVADHGVWTASDLLQVK